MPYQRKWVRDESTIKICEKSRQTGITWSTALEAALLAGMRAQDGGKNCRYVTHKQPDAKTFIGYVVYWAEKLRMAHQLIRPESASGSEFLKQEVRFASGNIVEALSRNPTNARGGKGYLILDEAAYIDLEDFIASGAAYQIWGGRIAIISTHNGVNNAFNRRVEMALQGEYEASHHKVTLKQALAEGLYRRRCFVQGVPWTEEGERIFEASLRKNAGIYAAQEYDCQPAGGEDEFIASSVVENCMTKLFKVERLHKTSEFSSLDPETRDFQVLLWCKKTLYPHMDKLNNESAEVYVGYDFARMSNSDVSSIAIGRMKEGMMLEVPLVVEMRGIPGRQQTLVLEFLINRLQHFQCLAVDADGVGIDVAERAKDRWKRRCLMVGISEKNGGEGGWSKIWPKALIPYRQSMQDCLVLLPRDNDVYKDHLMFSTIGGHPGLPKDRVKGADGLPRHADTAVSCMLCHFASRSNAGQQASYLDALTSGYPG